MNGFAHTDGSKVAVALVGEYDFAGIGTFNAGCNSRSSAVCGFDHINGEVIISHNGTANRSDTNGSAFDSEFVNNFRNKAVNNAVGAAGAVMKNVIGKGFGFIKNNCHDYSSPFSASLMEARISSTVVIIPPTLVQP